MSASVALRKECVDCNRGTGDGTREYTGRTPQGVRGLKQARTPTWRCNPCRTPQGVRGLKPVSYTHLRAHAWGLDLQEALTLHPEGVVTWLSCYYQGRPDQNTGENQL